MKGRPRPVLWPALAFLAVLAAFHPAVGNGFVSWDDDLNFIQNPAFRGLGLAQLRWMFTTVHLGPYQPLSWLSCGLDYALWGLDPRGYHLTSILLHALNAALFCMLALRLLPKAFEGVELRERDLGWAAFFAAGVFALHPLRAESVAWVTERRDVLSGFFYLLCGIVYVDAAELEAAPRRRRLRLSATFFAAALLSKASVVALPAALLLLDVWPLRRLPSDPRRWGAADARGALYEKLPFAALSLLAGGMALYAQHEAGALWTMREFTLLQRVSQSAYGLAFYLEKLLWPVRLFPLYESPQPVRPWLWPYGPSILFVLAASAGALALWRRRQAPLVLWGYYVLMLFPVLGLVKFGQQATADRYTYHSCMGWAMLAGALLLSGLRRPRGGLLLPPALALLLGLGALGRAQALTWKDSETLWRHALSINPRHIYAHNNLGTALMEQGRCEEALAQFDLAVRSNPADVKPYYNRGNALVRLKRPREAAAAYRQALEIAPDHADARSNLERLLAEHGELRKGKGL